MVSGFDHMDIRLRVEPQHPRTLGVGRRGRGEQVERAEQRRRSYHRLASFKSRSIITRSALRSPELTKVNDAAFFSRESCSGVASRVWASSRNRRRKSSDGLSDSHIRYSPATGVGVGPLYPRTAPSAAYP